MEDLLLKIIPWLDKLRLVIFKIAEYIAKAIEVDVNNVYLILLLILSWWIGKKIFGIFYSTSEGRTGYLLIIIGIIFYVLKYLGTT